MVANKVVQVMVMLEVEEDTTTPTIEMEMVTKIILEEITTLFALKMSHTYSVSNVRGVYTIS